MTVVQGFKISSMLSNFKQSRSSGCLAEYGLTSFNCLPRLCILTALLRWKYKKSNHWSSLSQQIHCTLRPLLQKISMTICGPIVGWSRIYNVYFRACNSESASEYQLSALQPPLLILLFKVAYSTTVAASILPTLHFLLDNVGDITLGGLKMINPNRRNPDKDNLFFSWSLNQEDLLLPAIVVMPE